MLNALLLLLELKLGWTKESKVLNVVYKGILKSGVGILCVHLFFFFGIDWYVKLKMLKKTIESFKG